MLPVPSPRRAQRQPGRSVLRAARLASCREADSRGQSVVGWRASGKGAAERPSHPRRFGSQREQVRGGSKCEHPPTYFQLGWEQRAGETAASVDLRLPASHSCAKPISGPGYWRPGDEGPGLKPAALGPTAVLSAVRSTHAVSTWERATVRACKGGMGGFYYVEGRTGMAWVLVTGPPWGRFLALCWGTTESVALVTPTLRFTKGAVARAS